jgi:RimJ/RimL family protein N-acetyltransferase
VELGIYYSDGNLPEGLSFNVEGLTAFHWKPSLKSITPPDQKNVKYALLTIACWIGIFKNRDYSFLYLKDGENIVLRCGVLPAYFRWSFMGKDDLQIMRVWTDPVYRGRGLAKYAIATCISFTSMPERHYWSVIYADNDASISAFTKLGFVYIGFVKRTSSMGIKYLSRYNMVQCDKKSSGRD